MLLITASEVSSIAFVNSLDPDFILPEFIIAAHNKYIVHLVTQPVLDLIDASPAEYTILVNEYIKPYFAFCVKYMFYNQLITETSQFQTSDQQRIAAVQEIIEIKQVLYDLLYAYLNASIFYIPVSATSVLHGGFRLTCSGASGTAFIDPNTNITSLLNSLSSALPSDSDTIAFSQVSSGLLKKATWSTFRQALKSFLAPFYEPVNPDWNSNSGLSQILNRPDYPPSFSTGSRSSSSDPGTLYEISFTDDYIFYCVQTGDSGNAVWKKSVLFQT